MKNYSLRYRFWQKIGRFFAKLLLVLLAAVYLWQFLPPIASMPEFILMNQTVRLVIGVLALLYIIIAFFVFPASRIFLAGIAVVALILIWSIHPVSLGKVTQYDCPKADSALTIYNQNIQASSQSADSLLRILNQLQPDLIALQEVGFKKWQQLFLQLKTKGYTGYRGRHPEEYKSSLSYAVFTRLECRNNRSYLLSGPEWLPEWNIQYLEVNYRGQWVALFNVHLNSVFSDREPPEIELNNHWVTLEQLKEIMALVEEQGLPAIIVGDFNKTPTSKYMKPVDDWNDAWMEAGLGFGYTWHSKFPLFRIDYCFYDSCFRALSCKVIENHFSDHLGLLTAIAYSED